MKLIKEQSTELLKIIDRTERLTEEFLFTLRRARRTIEMSVKSAIPELLLTAYEQKERSTLLCRSLPLYSPEPIEREKISTVLTDATLAKCGYTEQGWFCTVIPTLLPKKRKGSADYIRTIIYALLEMFFADKPIKKFRECAIVFRHIYNRSNPKRAWRDHDNIEVKAVIDAIALYVMEDDSSHICDHHYFSAEGDMDKTEVYVIPRSEYIKWHKMQSEIPDNGLKLYPTSPQKQV